MTSNRGLVRAWFRIVSGTLLLITTGQRCGGETAPTPWTVSRWSVGLDGQFRGEPLVPQQSLRVVAGSVLPHPKWAAGDWPEFRAALGKPRWNPAWSMDRWTVQHGLPQNRVRTLCRTDDGYLWIGTSGGLARFDGRRFVTLREDNSPALQKITADIRSLVNGPDGQLWVMARQGIARLGKGREEVVWTAPAGVKFVLRDLAFGADGTVWVGTHLGLRRLVGDQLRSEGIPELASRSEIVTVRLDAQGAVWMGVTPGGLLRWQPHEAVVETILPLGSPAAQTSGIAMTPGGEVWIGLLEGTTRWKAGTLSSVPLPSDFDPGVVLGLHPNRLTTGPHGDVWMSAGSRGALCKVSADGFQAILTSAGAPLDDVASILEDSEGNLWCGTGAGGLVRLRRQSVVPLAIDDPVTASQAKSVVEGPGGSIWCGGRGGVVIWSASQAAIFRYPYSPRSIDVFALGCDSDGDVWSTFTPSGVLRVRTGTAHATPADGPPRSELLAQDLIDVRAILMKTRSGDLWLGSGTGLHGWDGEWQTVPKDSGLPHADVRGIHEDSEGHLWVATYGGGVARSRTRMPRLGEIQFERWGMEQGLSDDRAWSFHEDSEGVIWVATHGGLSRIEQGRCFAFTTRHGLVDDLINQVLEDDFGRLWISCNRGIFRMDRSALNAIARGERDHAPSVLYDESDGMLSAETNGEYQSAGCRARDGRLYFPTQRGLVVIDPPTIRPDRPPPRVMIEQVLAEGVPVWGDETAQGDLQAPGQPKDSETALLRLSPSHAHSVAIRYTAGALTASERVRFEHRLEGLDTAWQPGNPDRVAYYHHLRPGRYRFLIRAADRQGAWSDPGTGLVLQLDPEFWQTWTFRGLLLALAAAVVAAIQAYRLQVQRKFMRLEQHHALELERTRISRDLHDQLGASLSRLSLSAGREGVSSGQVREMLQEVRELIWTVSPRFDSLPRLADFLGNTAQQYLEAAGIQLELRIPSTLPSMPVSSRTRQHIAAAFKESLRNVVQHARASEVRIELELNHAELRLCIEDDGIGFMPGVGVQRPGGLENLHQRLAELGGACEVQSKPGVGTRIEFRLPLSKA